MKSQEAIERGISALQNRVNQIDRDVDSHHGSVRKILMEGLEKDSAAIVALEEIIHPETKPKDGQPSKL